MGEGSEGTEASGGSRKNNGLDSREAHYLGGRPPEDRCRTAGTLGKVES
jgi:hypothetical protein